MRGQISGRPVRTGASSGRRGVVRSGNGSNGGQRCRSYRRRVRDREVLACRWTEPCCRYEVRSCDSQQKGVNANGHFVDNSCCDPGIKVDGLTHCQLVRPRDRYPSSMLPLLHRLPHRLPPPLRHSVPTPPVSRRSRASGDPSASERLAEE